MKRLILFLALLVFALPAAAAPAWVQSDGSFSLSTAAASQTDTLTHTSTAGHALVVFIAWKTTTVNFTSVTSTGCTFSPYQNEYFNGTSVGVQIAIGLNCPATSSITVTWSGTTVADTQVEEYSGVSSIGLFANASGTSTAPAITITTEDANNLIVVATASLATGGVPTSNTGNLRNASRSGTTTSFEAGAACDNTAASAGTALKCQVTITSVAWVAVGIELRSVNPADPLLVDTVGTNTASSVAGGNGFVIYLPQPTLTGNAVICGASYPYTTTRTLTISDNMSNTWATAVTLNNGTSGNVGDLTDVIVYAKNVAAGTVKITFTFNAAVNDFQAACKEAYHVSTAASILDGTSTANGAGSGINGPIIASGSITTATAGDLIFQYGQSWNSGSDLNTASQGVTGYAAGSGWSMIDGSIVTGQFFQDIQQASAGAITPSYDVESITGGIPNVYSTVAAAFLTDNSKGTAPPATGIHIDHQTGIDMLGGNNPTVQIPADGNFLSVGVTATGNTYVFKDSQQNAYTQSAPGNAILAYAAGATVNASQKIVVTNTGANNAEMVIRDIRGVATSSPIDVTNFASGSQASLCSGCTLTAAPVLPSAGNFANSNELVIWAMQNGCGPPQNLSAPTGAITDSIYYTGQTDADTYDQGEGHGHFYISSTAQISFTVVMQNNVAGQTCTAPNSWGVAAWALKALPSGASSWPQIFVIRP